MTISFIPLSHLHHTPLYLAHSQRIRSQLRSRLREDIRGPPPRTLPLYPKHSLPTISMVVTKRLVISLPSPDCCLERHAKFMGMLKHLAVLGVETSISEASLTHADNFYYHHQYGGSVIYARNYSNHATRIFQ